MTRVLHTIGYEASDLGRCLSALGAHAIETVLDVREWPLSRKPGFSKRALAVSLGRRGIEYIHMPAFGCPKAIRVQYRAERDWSCYRTAFLEYLDTQNAAVQALAEKASQSRCALLCFEADPNFCHRSLVAAAVAAQHEMAVRHILPAGLLPGAVARKSPL